jgi:hypothetical protein
MRLTDDLGNSFTCVGCGGPVSDPTTGSEITADDEAQMTLATSWAEVFGATWATASAVAETGALVEGAVRVVAWVPSSPPREDLLGDVQEWPSSTPPRIVPANEAAADVDGDLFEGDDASSLRAIRQAEFERTSGAGRELFVRYDGELIQILVVDTFPWETPQAASLP